MKRLLSILAVVAFGAGVLYGHHGWTGYDETKLIEHKGVIKEVGWENPHAFVKVEIDKAVWNIVLAPVFRMQERGIARDTLKVGATVTIAGYQHKQIKDEIRAERITFNGKTTELR
jgi:hypothetical protein